MGWNGQQRTHADASGRGAGRSDVELMRWRVGIAAMIFVVVVVAVVAGNMLAVRFSPHTTNQAPVALTSFALSGTGTSNHTAGAPPATATVNCDCTPSRSGSLTTAGSGSCVLPASGKTGKFILVCISREWLYAYQDGKQVFDTGVWTGMPQLPTPQGTFHIFFKGTNLTFTSPYPKGSPFWYYPTHINYAMEFDEPGYYLHDAWWHESFGPGAAFLHQNADGTWENGSYGCVGMTVAASKWLYDWTDIGMPVLITY